MVAPAARVAASLPAHARVHSVWEVCQRVKHVLAHDDLLPDVWVRGEVSNVKLASSGHAYFVLKDEHAQLACVAWNARARLRFELKDGLSVLLRARLDLYDQRGQVQAVADEIVPDGHGKLHLAFEQLKERLAKEGLFDAARKRPLPAVPQRVALVTSLHGAALRDMLRILAARFPLVEVVVRAARVQGEGAPMEIAAAIRHVNEHAHADLIIVGRGGGSLEDLWAFNDEQVARAIASSGVPVMSAVGHETDVTIADFVADLRAPTPSGAAELATPDQQDLRDRLALLDRALSHRADRTLDGCGHRLRGLEERAALRKPERLLEGWTQRLDDATARLAASGQGLQQRAGERLALAAARLDSYSPLRTLQRGYAIVSVDGRPATSVVSLPTGAVATLQVADGSVRAVVQA
ncbi:MAG TPA: exodeoxyribonuclease VII large subunit [Candidatus Thermoplasmatota archaeon]|jgi:exodeoxyribonuclease VII large subunit|nr:exodeoxyribonuclease VII large subunit [Candidatus Thermoplasmatota archaeon]